MSWTRWACVLAGTGISACNHPTPRTGLASGVRPRHVIGSTVEVVASWEATCTDWGLAFQSVFNKNDDDPSDSKVTCKEKPFAVEVSCSTRCEHTEPVVAKGATTVGVVPRELGPLVITAVSTRTDTNEVHRASLPAIVIALPDRLELRCWLGAETAPKLCGPDGVDAAHPILVPVVQLDGVTEVTTALTVNGAPVPADFASHPRVSLADLYPDARRGDGVEPGTYRVELAVGSVIGRWKVVAR